MASKKKTVIALVSIVVIAGIVVGVLLLTNKKDTKTAPVTSGTSKIGTSKELSDAEKQAPLDPTSVAQNLPKYKDQYVSLRGSVYQLQSKDYYLVGGRQGDSSGAIKLDFSKSGLDPAKYATQPPQSAADGQHVVAKAPVTVVGKISTSKVNGKDGQSTLVISSIK